MCYYNSQKIILEKRIRLKDFEKSLSGINYLNKELISGFDYGLSTVIRASKGSSGFEMVKMEWGFIPHYINTRSELNLFRKGSVDSTTGKFKPPVLTLNAIGEELFEKTTYRQAAQTRRCLVISSGFYEWRHVFPINKRTGKPTKTANKIPYRIYVSGQEYFYLAAIWTPWVDKETGEYLESFAIVTTKANSLMRQIHNTKMRMPVILNEDLAFEWLSDTLSQQRIIEIASTQFPAELMSGYPIEKKFRESSHPATKAFYDDLPEITI